MRRFIVAMGYLGAGLGAVTSGRRVPVCEHPEIIITVTASQSADLHAVHQRIETEALTHARQALGQADLPIQLDLDVSR